MQSHVQIFVPERERRESTHTEKEGYLYFQEHLLKEFEQRRKGKLYYDASLITRKREHQRFVLLYNIYRDVD